MNLTQYPKELHLNSRNQPDPQELRLFPGRAGLALHLQRVDVGDGDDGGRHVPGEAQEGADRHQDAHPEQIQVIAAAFLPRAPCEMKPH